MVMAMMEDVCAKFLATYRQKFTFPQALYFFLTCKCGITKHSSALYTSK